MSKCQVEVAQEHWNISFAAWARSLQLCDMHVLVHFWSAVAKRCARFRYRFFCRNRSNPFRRFESQREMSREVLDIAVFSNGFAVRVNHRAFVMNQSWLVSLFS